MLSLLSAYLIQLVSSFTRHVRVAGGVLKKGIHCAGQGASRTRNKRCSKERFEKDQANLTQDCVTGQHTCTDLMLHSYSKIDGPDKQF